MRILRCRIRPERTACAVLLTLFVSFGLFFVTRKGDVERRTQVIFIEAAFAQDTRPSNRESKKSGCVQPILRTEDPVMMKFYEKIEPMDCQKYHQDLAYVDNGTIRFSKALTANTSCKMYPLIRGPGDYKTSLGNPIENVQDKTALTSDFFKLVCVEDNEVRYDNIHLGVHFNTTLKNRLKAVKPPPNGLQLSVVMLGFDSMSRMSWLRRLPKTRDYFVNQLGAIELKGYNIMGDGTPAALFPILTGKHEQELPEARRKVKGAKPVDDFPWIWKDFQQNGYLTSWADSEIDIAPFNYRLLGFQNIPTDFFMRPFYLAVNSLHKRYKKGCHGSLRKQQVWFNFARDIMTMYKDDPKFLFHFYATLSHGNNNLITTADEDLEKLLLDLEEGGYLDNTLFILFGDHGCRFSTVRATLSGKFEERMPYFALRFPKWFHTKHPDLIRNLKINSERLTTPLDIHETLRDILRFDGSGMGNLQRRGISLFKEIPQERTCAHADVAPHWCACMSWKNTSVEDPGVRIAAGAAVDFINSLTKDYREDCALLSVKRIVNAYKTEISDSMLRFKETKGDRGLDPILSANTKADRFLYQLTLITAPSDGEFEITLQQDFDKNEFIVDPKAISRINKYGKAPSCILDRNREIRQYCYCNHQKTY